MQSDHGLRAKDSVMTEIELARAMHAFSCSHPMLQERHRASVSRDKTLQILVIFLSTVRLNARISSGM